MKIYTKTGDKGETSLFGGKRVQKDNIRVEAYGAVDETNACIGLARSCIHEGSSGSREGLYFIDSVLETVQNKLFAIGAVLAGSDDQTYTVKESDIEFLEKVIDKIDEQIPAIKSFILPFGTDLCTRLHVGRTVSRRAERRIVSLSAGEPVDPRLLAYMNRLSDFLFTLARYANKAQGVVDIPWKKEQKELPQQQQLFPAKREDTMIQLRADNSKGPSNHHQDSQ